MINLMNCNGIDLVSAYQSCQLWNVAGDVIFGICIVGILITAVYYKWYSFDKLNEKVKK